MGRLPLAALLLASALAPSAAFRGTKVGSLIVDAAAGHRAAPAPALSANATAARSAEGDAGCSGERRGGRTMFHASGSEFGREVGSAGFGWRTIRARLDLRRR